MSSDASPGVPNSAQALPCIPPSTKTNSPTRSRSQQPENPYKIPSRRQPQISKSEQESQWRQQAWKKAQQGDHATAIAILSGLIEQNPTNASNYNNRGLIYFQSGALEQAIADYNQALILNPNLASVYNNRANYYAAQGQLAEAIADYDLALDFDPSNIRAWINQGITFRDLEMYSRALENFEIALHWGQLQGHVYAERGRTYHLLGDWNWAIADYQRALTHLSPTYWSSTSPSHRLCMQVQSWIEEILGP